MKVLKLNSISPVADGTFKGYEYSETAENPDGIILRSFGMHDYSLGENLLAVARAGAGVNNIPIDRCTEKGIVVFNTPGANANAVKELVLCELFLGGRQIVEGAAWAQSLKGQDGVPTLVEKGKGKFVGQEVLSKGMINAKTLEQCKDGVVIINNARGDLVVSKDIISAVQKAKVSRYITDFPDEELLGKENILCIPHLGASTPEAEDNCAYMAAKQLTDYLENGNITNSVNFPAVSMPRGSISRVCVHHKNVKEMLSKILAIVSSQGINVAHMQDCSKGEYAYLILDLDEVPSDSTLELIRNVSGVLRGRKI